MGATAMSDFACQPCASRSRSRDYHGAQLDDPEKAVQVDLLIPSGPDDSYLNDASIFTQPMSGVNKGPAVNHTEQLSFDTDRYSQAFSPSTLAPHFLTPEFSSENQFSDPSVPNTPSWEDSWWEPETLLEPVAPDNDEPNLHSHLVVNDVAYGGNQTRSSKDLEAYFLPKPPRQLVSPQLTNTPSPSGQHIQSLTMGPTSVPLSREPSGEMERNPSSASGLRLNPHQTMVNSGFSPGSLQPSPANGLNPAPSPILKVSTYIRGDSPARSGFGMVRSSSKRSRTSQSSNLLAPANHYSSEEEEEEEEEEEVHKQDTLRQIQAQKGPSYAARAEDGSWMPNRDSGQTGLDPAARGDAYVPSLKEIEEKRQLDEKNAEVSSWLDKSEAGSELGEENEARTHPRGRRSTRIKPRAHSTGARIGTLKLDSLDDSSIPGPGVLLDEDSEAAYTDDSASYMATDRSSLSPPADVDLRFDESRGYFPPVVEFAPECEEPLPRQFVRAQPWQDSMRGPILHDEQYQPATSNAAMYKYDLLAAKFETASRAATWGTRRRLSETDIQSIISGQSVRKLSLVQKTRQRGNSFVKQASRLIPRRSSSNAKKTDLDIELDNSSSESLQKKRADTLSSLKSLQRIPSIGKTPKSPPLNTGGAFLAMTSPLTALGRSTSATPDSGAFPSSPWKALKRQRSKSEIPRTKSSGTPGLAELMTNHGGPPIPALVSPMQERLSTDEHPQGRVADDDGEDADEEEERSADQGVRIDLKVKIDNIVPNLDGFRIHAKQLNPRLETFLTERIILEQVRRYKKLVEYKVKHTHAVKNLKQCGSNRFCFELGGEAKDLPPRTSMRDPEATCAQFQVSGNVESDGEANTFAEGIVSAALFPAGIPLPPVKKLPAEFECSLCFKVKKFQKPSDWTKHVHEDVQPFTCTFADCSEARSFKRKADWVRHENERHRHLEWWQCNMPECNHTCYRKDNFVQHLVREHKKREPKVKARGSISSKTKSEADSVSAWQAQVHDAEIEEVWKLVDMCHFETKKKPKDEVCKFCGNVCSSWKKLTVHLAKHMEQIAMPVLELVKHREVSPDTIISPVERISRQQRLPIPTSPRENLKAEQAGLSPYVMNITPQHAVLPATQSPGAYSQDSHYTPSMRNSPSFSHTPASTYEHQPAVHAPDMVRFAQIHNLPADMSYGPYQSARQPSSFIPINTPGVVATSTYPPPFHGVRRSPQPIMQNSSRSHPGFVQVDTTYGAQPPPLPMYSSPTDTGPYPAQFHLSVEQMQNYTTSAMEYVPDGGSTGMVMPQNLLYDPHQNRQQGPPFLAHQANDQNYSYASE